MIIVETLAKICNTKSGKEKCKLFAPLLNAILPQFKIDTTARQAMFIAQALHESGEFQYLHELGNTTYFDKYDTGTIAKRLGNTPEKDGDGEKYKGRGIFQITGKSNYYMCGKALGLNLLDNPELLELPENAVKSACWFWNMKNLNKHADNGAITACSIAINGGTNGLDERKKYWNSAKLTLGI